MPLILPGNVASATAAAAYSVDNSCRFNDGDSPYMHKTPTSTGSRRTFTFSSWVKRGDVEADEYAIFTGGVDANVAGFFTIMFDANNKIDIQFYDGGWDQVTTNRVFRDPSAWYHIVVAVDTTQGTDTNRIKLYVNGVQETSLSSTDYPTQNFDMDVNNTDDIMQVGVRRNSSAALAGYLDAYLAETVLIDGTAYAASDFGEFDSDSPNIWKPIDVSGLTFGTNGFYLDYKASDNLGNDANGGTDLTEVNLAAVDQCTDTPTNNFCTVNPLDNFFTAGTFSEGNNTIAIGAGEKSYTTGTIWLSSGKWYWEVFVTTRGATGSTTAIGIANEVSMSDDKEMHGSFYTDNWAYNGAGNIISYGESSDDTGVTYDDDDIIGCYMDLDNNLMYWAKNGTILNSGAGTTIVAPASLPTSDGYTPSHGNHSGSQANTVNYNFGATSFGATAISSANSDSNSVGNFEYSPNDGGSASFDSAAKNFLAICTKNLGSDGG
jgi:hypothetical protein